MDEVDELVSELRDGRGSALRRVLSAPDRATHRAAVAALLRTPWHEQDLDCGHVLGHAELLAATAVDLAPWFEWIRTQGDDGSCDGESGEGGLYHFRLLEAAVAQGLDGCRSFLIELVRTGRHWRSALLHLDATATDAELWRLAEPHMTKAWIERWYDPNNPTWSELARNSEKVAAVAASLREGPYRTELYGTSRRSSLRWKIVAHNAGEPEVDAWLVDGLWDAHASHRINCIRAVDVEREGVRDRLIELARSPHDGVRTEAKRRLDRTGPPAEPPPA